MKERKDCFVDGFTLRRRRRRHKTRETANMTNAAIPIGMPAANALTDFADNATAEDEGPMEEGIDDDT
jgi:hypothetical protein